MNSGENSDAAPRGYGNIYTPHAGAMVIQVQRESGLANRTFVLSQRQVRLLRAGGITVAIVFALGSLSWVFLAAQAARVPLLTHRVEALQHDVQRLDTLQRALTQLEGRFQQVQTMMGATPSGSMAPAASPTAAPSPSAHPANAALGSDSIAAAASVPHAWPLPIAGTLLSSTSSGTAHGIDVGVPARTPIRASGAGVVVDVQDDSTLGTLVRIAHRNGYESVYANTIDVRVRKGERVPAGAIIAVTGDSTGALPPHLHFEILRRGVDIDPSSLMTKGPDHGDLQ